MDVDGLEHRSMVGNTHFFYKDLFYKNHQGSDLVKRFTKIVENLNLQMKVNTERSILSISLEVGVGGKIEKLGLKIKNIRGSEKKV